MARISLLSIISLLFLAGCGQGVPVVVQQPAAAPAPAKTTEELALEKMTPEQRSLYATGKELIRKRLLEFPNVSADWETPVYSPPEPGKVIPVGTTNFTNSQAVGGTVTAGDNAGKREPRKWTVIFAEPDQGRGKLIPVMWTLGEKRETFLSLDKD